MMSALRKTGTALRTKAGTSAIEFGLLAPLLLAVVIGITEFSRMMWYQNTLQSAASAGSRYFAINTSATAADVKTAILTYLSGLDSNDVTVVTGTSTVGGTQYRIVTITYDFFYIFSGFGLSSSTLSGKSSTPINP